MISMKSRVIDHGEMAAVMRILPSGPTRDRLKHAVHAYSYEGGTSTAELTQAWDAVVTAAEETITRGHRFAAWREANQPDPYHDAYWCRSDQLPGDTHSDDDVALQLLATLLRAPDDPSTPRWIEAGAARVRWLSRRLYAALRPHADVTDGEQTTRERLYADSQLHREMIIRLQEAVLDACVRTGVEIGTESSTDPIEDVACATRNLIVAIERLADMAVRRTEESPCN